MERHIPPRLGPDPASAAAILGAAQAAAGSNAAGACSSVSDVPQGSSASSSPAVVTGEAAAAAATVAGSVAGAGQSTAAEAARTFLTDPGSQLPSPMRAVPAAGARLDAAAACIENIQTAAGMGAAAADPQPAPALPIGVGSVPQAAAVGQHNSWSPPAATHTVTETAGAHGCYAGKHALSTADASSRLLCFAQGGSPPRLGPPPVAASPSGHPANAVLQRPCSPSTQRPTSPIRRPGSPHWAPVPPKTQLQPPVVVRPM